MKTGVHLVWIAAGPGRDRAEPHRPVLVEPGSRGEPTGALARPYLLGERDRGAGRGAGGTGEAPPGAVGRELPGGV